MAQYDAAVLSKEADKLYSRANFLIVLYIIAGLVGGFVAFVLMLKPAGLFNSGMAAVLAAAVIIAYGMAKADEYKYKAQMILVMQKIETNTRP